MHWAIIMTVNINYKLYFIQQVTVIKTRLPYTKKRFVNILLYTT